MILVRYETRRKVQVMAIRAPSNEMVALKPAEDCSVGLLNIMSRSQGILNLKRQIAGAGETKTGVL